MTLQSDVELWRRATTGDERAFATLFERHIDAVYNYCFRRIGDWSVAEDLAADVFLEAWRQREKVSPHGESLRPWLLGVATNLIRNHQRSLHRQQHALRRLSNQKEESDFADDVVDRLSEQEEMKIVLAGLRNLDSLDQDILALCVWEKLSYEAAATALDLPIGTVRSRLSRLRSKLRDGLVVKGAPSRNKGKLMEFKTKEEVRE
jgi:RNA polymerase sigma factor (sigma-70 family)